MKGAVCQHSCCSSQRLCHFLWHCPTFNGCSGPLQDPLFGFVLIANLQQALWQPGTPTTPWVFPSLGVVFLRGYLDTDQNLARFQPGQKQSHKSSHQGKLSSLREVPWPRCYLHIFIYITVAHRGWAETKVPWHFTLCTYKDPAPSSKGCCSQLILYTTVRSDLPRAPQSAARPKICQHPPSCCSLQPVWKDPQSLFSQQLEVWSDLPPCQKSSPALVILPRLSLQERFRTTKPQYKVR